ncbi:uncharacterized protein TRIADDRAFT_62372 [Trichoplax adhaerens]|uniref:Uncharacterized protein n=1 Tax=Trichoplax adhaerens TaxID=10228 RepID=B3SDL4_TRIAD|nr:predicted protein [Trichoplax adhaerens]EDV19185.1 predicted protein [Trichoplax adhaerens]|eukprot:XP_002118334.1 predicted protein [Trichoplax adhaerens]
METAIDGIHAAKMSISLERKCSYLVIASASTMFQSNINSRGERNRKLTMAFNYIQIYELGLLKSHKMREKMFHLPKHLIGITGESNNTSNREFYKFLFRRAIRSLLTLSKDGEEQTGTVWSHSLFFFCKEFKSE